MCFLVSFLFSWSIQRCEWGIKSPTIIVLLLIFPFILVQFSSVQSLSRVQLFATPWTEAHQASLSITNSQSSLRLTSIKSVMPSSHLILCRPLLLLPPISPSITVFSNESSLHMKWPKYWSFSFSISLPMNTQDCSPLEWTCWISLQFKGLSRVFSNTTFLNHQVFPFGIHLLQDLHSRIVPYQASSLWQGRYCKFVNVCLMVLTTFPKI